MTLIDLQGQFSSKTTRLSWRKRI